MTDKSKSIIFVIIASVSGGTNAVAAKYALEVFQPFTVVFLRFFFASLVLLPLIIHTGKLNKYEFKNLAKVGIVGAFNPILLFIALQYTQASFSPLIYAIVPAMTAIYLWLIEKKKLPLIKIIGIIIGIVGVASVVMIPLFEGKSVNVTLKGNLIILLAAVAFVYYGILSKKAQSIYQSTPLSLTFYLSIVTMVISIPFALNELIANGLSESITWMHIMSGVYAGVIGTGLFYITYQYALKLSSEVTASIFTFLQPISGILAAVIILGDNVSTMFIFGGSLAVFGAYLISRDKK
jgi:drug/metabolite transporter (DMT)-like permease